MQKQILNYLILIEPDTRTGTNEPCYSVFCPTLGISDSGDTIEEAVKNMKELIRFHLSALASEGEYIPMEQTEHSLLTTIQVPYPNAA